MNGALTAWAEPSALERRYGSCGGEGVAEEGRQVAEQSSGALQAGTRPDPLTGPRRRANYTDAERRFSTRLQQRLDEVLAGKCDEVALLRKYPQEPNRLGCLPLPDGVARAEVRVPVVEQLTWDAIAFLRTDAVGGPISQSLAGDGIVVEYQAFPTKYPHILICRTDRYAGDDGADAELVEITWCVQRVQNQRRQTQINRLLDAANLAFEILRVLR
jgi:hypothetical protein